MSPRTYKASEQTKNSILQKAVELFNEHGTASVSMNALAESLGISAGNLQYHYKGKEDLIRAILEEMFRQFDGIYRSIEGTFTLDILRQTMRLHFHLVWKYRFFYREQGALLRNDEALADRFRAIQAQRMDEQEALMKRLAASGGVRGNLSPEELRNVVLIGWVLGNTLLAYNESLGQKIDEAAQAQALEIMIQHYKPYLLETK
ncbi:MAG: TetR/AcrR family transcriptional regulator [Chloroflexi bacterium]|nr:TetR/AcrR family transcriptional regulator [Chloroflexota bacterium]